MSNNTFESRTRIYVLLRRSCRPTFSLRNISRCDVFFDGGGEDAGWLLLFTSLPVVVGVFAAVAVVTWPLVILAVVGVSEMPVLVVAVALEMVVLACLAIEELQPLTVLRSLRANLVPI